MNRVLSMKRGDRRPFLEVRLEERDGSPLDLTGAAQVVFSMGRAGEAPVVERSPAVVLDAAQGRAEYRWASGDTDEVGEFRGEFSVEWSPGEVETQPADGWLVVRVLEAVAPYSPPVV